ncbi:MAG: hypothetical protein M3008_05570 [Chloroflexota bacterium]|nr:hypothetical protein [Chloroflexota bacterium]
MQRFAGRFVSIVPLGLLLAASVAAAPALASPAFQKQWHTIEAVQPNFWGPNLFDVPGPPGQQEPYKEAPGGTRLVQYFDKARMELTVPAGGRVTNGLLTVELKSGKIQVGDATFVPVPSTPGIARPEPPGTPSAMKIAGDGNTGPAYADLNQLAERDPVGPEQQASSALMAGTPMRYNAATGTFSPTTDLPMLNIPPGPLYAGWSGDSGGRYGQYVFRPFADFIRSLPLPMDRTTGFPISPLIVAEVSVGGKTTTVLIQAFERRVLTFNPKNPDAFKVEFGNIGRHYYEWRYHPGA